MTRQEREKARAYIRRRAKEDFVSFLHAMFPQVEGQAYRLGKLHLALAELVQDAIEGKARFHATSVPPQHGKSQLLSVRAVAWLIGSRPGIHIAMTGFSDQLLRDFLHDVTAVMESERYRDIFPGVHPKRGRDRADAKTYTNNSSVMVKASGSKLTGRKVDWLIVDDAHAGRAEAESEHQRNKIKNWFYADCLSRLTPNASVFVVGTRWHPDDLIGILTSPDSDAAMADAGYEDQQFRVTNFRAIAKEGDPLGRVAGEALFPEERPLAFLEALKARLPFYDWMSLYEGEPRSAKSGNITVSNLRIVGPDEVPAGLEQTRGWDLAITEEQTADYTAGARLAYDKENDMLYIAHIYREQMAWPRLFPAMVNISLQDAQTLGIRRIGVEGVGGFEAVYAQVKDRLLGQVSVVKKNPGRGGKLMRAQPWLVKLEAGKVALVRGPWNAAFLAELEAFPEGKKDDQIDAVSIGYETLNGPHKKGGLFIA